MYDKRELIQLFKDRRAIQFGDFTLASGKKSDFYVDCRRVTLDPRGANLVAEGVLDLLGEPLPDCVGGLVVGADPITAAVVTLAGQRQLPLYGFLVRKEPKKYGTARAVEGPVEAARTAAVVEDTVTTGMSTIRAIEAVKAAGIQVQQVIAVFDRLDEGAAAIKAETGLELQSLLTIADFGIKPADSTR